MSNILKFTQNSLVLIPYLLNYSPHSLRLQGGPKNGATLLYSF